jgi:deoxyribonuclease V
MANYGADGRLALVAARASRYLDSDSSDARPVATTCLEWPMMWPRSESELVELQIQLAARQPPPWRVPAGRPMMAGCFVCFARGARGRGRAGERAWASAALMRGNRGPVATALAPGKAGWPYEPGLLALREGPLLETAVRALRERPEVLIVNAGGRDHPRGAGLALHLGGARPSERGNHRPPAPRRRPAAGA